jgi:hypothetical protein
MTAVKAFKSQIGSSSQPNAPTHHSSPVARFSQLNPMLEEANQGRVVEAEREIHSSAVPDSSTGAQRRAPPAQVTEPKKAVRRASITPGHCWTRRSPPLHHLNHIIRSQLPVVGPMTANRFLSVVIGLRR